MTTTRDNRTVRAGDAGRVQGPDREPETPPAGVASADSVLDALDANIAVVDRDGIIRRVNQAWQRFARENGARGDFLNQSYLAACDPAGDRDAAEALRLTRAVIAGEIQQFALDYPCHSPCERRWFRLSGSHLPDSGGAVLMHFNVTERAERELASEDAQRELERRVRERTAALDRSNRELDAFAYAVAHDLKAPLRAVSGFAGILLRRLESQLEVADAQRLQRIERAAVRMSRLIESLLRLARLARLPIAGQSCDLSEMARQICHDLRTAEPARPSEIAIQSNVRGHGDPELLRALLDALLSNAWQFSRTRDSIRIDFSQAVVDGRAVYTVSDRGIGFDMAFYDKLFQPFQHLHEGDADAGDGLGLAFAKRIVELHGGELWAEGSTDEGAAFHFTLGA